MTTDPVDIVIKSLDGTFAKTQTALRRANIRRDATIKVRREVARVFAQWCEQSGMTDADVATVVDEATYQYEITPDDCVVQGGRFYKALQELYIQRRRTGDIAEKWHESEREDSDESDGDE